MGGCSPTRQQDRSRHAKGGRLSGEFGFFDERGATE